MSARANRVAIVGATSVLGDDLKHRLAAAGYSGDAVALLDLEEHVGLLTEYGDEARLVLAAADESLGGFVVVCFCGGRQTVERFAAPAAAAGTAIDCTGYLAAEQTVELVDQQGSPGASGLLAIPLGATLMLAQLNAVIDLPATTCTVMLPASELSDAGTEEMAQQASALLHLGEAPNEVFGRRLAFDAWPDATRPEGAAGRIRDELEQLGIQAPALHAVRGSIFHGIAASIYVPQRDAASLATALGPIAAIGAETDDKLPGDSPVRVAGRDGLHVGELRDDPRGGTWMWLLQDNHRAITSAALKAIDVRLGRPG